MKKQLLILSLVLGFSIAGLHAEDVKVDVKKDKTMVSDEKVPVGMKKCVVGDKTVVVAADATCPVGGVDLKKPADPKVDVKVSK